jgi:beta-xylosidase
MTRIVIWVFFLVLAGCDTGTQEVYLFSYFINNGEDGLHLAWSKDGLQWEALFDNSSILTPQAGVDRLMRDPCIIRGGDGKFHMVWTVSWNEQGIGYASSEDLIHWSEQKYLPVMSHEPLARNCWAPELFYDPDEELYLIYWATTIPGRFPETDSTGDQGYNHRIYCCTTPDFAVFSETRLLYDPGFNVIDATIQKVDGTYVMFLKDETRWPEPQKNIRVATASKPEGPYTDASEPITDHWVEGPTATRTDLGWVLYFDRYREHEMGAIRSTDLLHWTDISTDLRFPEGTRHGTVLKINRQELEKLLAAPQGGTGNLVE